MAKAGAKPGAAKTAHSKKQNKKAAGVELGKRFAFAKVLEVVTDQNGQKAAVVELDLKGTIGLVDAIYVREDASGQLVGGQIACPATYDAAAFEAAVKRYAAYQA